MKKEEVTAKLEAWKQNLEEKKANRVKSEPLTATQTASGVVGFIRLIVALISIGVAISFFMSCSSAPKVKQEVKTEVSTPAPEPVVEPAWKEIKTVDDFGDVVPGVSTKALYILDGKFSNSATTDSPLGVRIVDQLSKGKSYLCIDLYEYISTTPARLTYDGQFGSFSCKLADGTVKKVKCFAPKQGGLLFSEEDYKPFKKILTENKTIKCSISASDFNNNGSSYNFTIVQ